MLRLRKAVLEEAVDYSYKNRRIRLSVFIDRMANRICMNMVGQIRVENKKPPLMIQKLKDWRIGITLRRQPSMDR